MVECCESLLPGEEERLGFLAGYVNSDGVRCVERFIQLKPAEASAVFFKGDLSATFDTLMEIERWGYLLHAWVHSHPGRGALSTTPSTTDMNHQEQLERAGYRTIGIILCRGATNGALAVARAFSRGLPFELEIHGKEVTQIDDGIFRIPEIRSLPVQARTA